jgi:hypothetical protein
MSAYFGTLIGHTPKNIRRLILRADPLVAFSNKLTFDRVWVNTARDSLTLQIHSMKSIRELSELNFEGTRPGPALANELTTLAKHRDFDIDSAHTLIEVLLNSYLEVFSSTKNVIDKNKIDLVHVFNGRFLHEKAVWDATRQANVKTVLFETMRDRYLQRTEGFHDRENNQQEMLKLWENSQKSVADKVLIGSRYFQELRGRNNPFKTSGAEKISVNKPFFVYFSNSDDEAIGFWDKWNENLGRQTECVKKLQKIFDAQDKYELIIRLHPNLRNKSLKQKSEWALIENSKNSTIVDEGSQISSYDLLDNCVGTITFGSTLGLESAFALKPSLLLADSGYDLLGVADKPVDWLEVENWITSTHNKAHTVLLARRERACVRGFFLANGGEQFKYTNLVQTGWGAWKATSFDGVKIGSSTIISFWQIFLKSIKWLKIRKLIGNV